MSKNNEKKLVPKLRFPEFIEEGEWTETVLDSIVELKGRIGYRGYATEDLVEKGQGALVLGGKHIQNHTLDLSEPTFLSWEKYYESPEIMVEIGDIIFSQRGSLGDCAIIDKKIGPATINPSMVLLKNIACNAKFLYYTLVGEGIQKEVKKNKTSSAVPMLSQKQIKEFPFLYPTNPIEQQKIAACLSSLDEVITAESQKLDVLKEHKKGLLQNLFPQEGETEPRLRFKEFEESGKWEEITLGEICKVTSGGTPSRTNNDYWNGDIPWISTTLIDFNTINSANEYITKAGLQNSSAKIFPKDTILMAMYGQGKTRGKVAILGIEAATNQACAAILLKDGYNTNYVFQNLAGRYDEIRKFSNQGGQENLSGGLIENISITIPVNPKEQQKIAACLSSLDDLINAQSQKIEALKLHKKGLLQGLFPAMSES